MISAQKMWWACVHASRTARFIYDHPLASRARPAAFQRWLRWQLASRLSPGDSIVVPFVDEARLAVRPGMRGATGSVYTGLHEFEDMAFVAHFLRPGDLFVDVGANVGSYTVLAAKVAAADAIAIEPVPETYRRLLTNVHLNEIGGRVHAMNVGVGEARGRLRFTTALDCENHALDEHEPYDGPCVEVAVVPLDDITAERAPTAMKIDVEGFEKAVLDGAARTLGDSSLQALVIELSTSTPEARARATATHQRITALGFVPCGYEPFSRELTKRDGLALEVANNLYIRDVAAARERLRRAPQRRVLDQLF